MIDNQKRMFIESKKKELNEENVDVEGFRWSNWISKADQNKTVVFSCSSWGKRCCEGPRTPSAEVLSAHGYLGAAEIGGMGWYEVWIVDRKCQPIKYTKILIWQVGEDSKYPYAFLRSSANESMSSVLDFRKRSTFLGSGTTFSDNNGEFKFVSVFPSGIGKESSYVNIRIEADGYSFQTKVYLGRNVVKPFYNDNNLNYTMFDGVVFPLRNLSDKAGYRVYKFQICIE